MIRTPSGSRSVLVYSIVLDAFSLRWRVEALASQQPYAIIGRNVLNDLRLLLDGPKLELSVLT